MMILAIVGPTAVGKTKMSVELAKIFRGEIINCDAMQIYKGLDVGTAKATKEEMQKIPHHLLSIKDVEEDYSVYDYQEDARRCIKEIQGRGKVPIFVGGTGLYLKAALYDYKLELKEDSSLESNYSDEELKRKIESYHVDVKVDYHNRRRMIRMLEKLEAGWQPQIIPPSLLYSDVILIGLTTDREVLYQKIEERFDQMIVPLIDEVQPYYLKGIRTKALMTGIGYKELYSFFDHSKTLQEVILECKKNTRNYAKRQYTWFKNQMDVKWFEVNYEDFDQTIQEVVNYIKNIDVDGKKE